MGRPLEVGPALAPAALRPRVSIAILPARTSGRLPRRAEQYAAGPGRAGPEPGQGRGERGRWGAGRAHRPGSSRPLRGLGRAVRPVPLRERSPRPAAGRPASHAALSGPPPREPPGTTQIRRHRRTVRDALPGRGGAILKPTSQTFKVLLKWKLRGRPGARPPVSPPGPRGGGARAAPRRAGTRSRPRPRRVDAGTAPGAWIVSGARLGLGPWRRRRRPRCPRCCCWLRPPPTGAGSRAAAWEAASAQRCPAFALGPGWTYALDAGARTPQALRELLNEPRRPAGRAAARTRRGSPGLRAPGGTSAATAGPPG